MKNRKENIFRLAASLMSGMIMLSVAQGLGLPVPLWLIGSCGWLASILLLSRLNRLQRIQVGVILSLGILGLSWGVWEGGDLPMEQVLSANQALIVMFLSITSLRLISQPVLDKSEQLPQGRRAMWQTALSTHLFGAFINMSAVVIIGDRLAQHRPLSALQAVLLSRSFSLAALWTPFFAAMGVAISYAPGATLKTLILWNLPVALLGMLYSVWAWRRCADSEDFVGYPVHLAALKVPFLLMLTVILLHESQPAISILTVIALSALMLTVLMIIWRQGLTGLRLFVQHMLTALPGSSGELSLFLAAGVMATGLLQVAAVTDFSLPFRIIGPLEATGMMAFMLLLSLIGVHPVISITSLSGLLVPLTPDPNLLGIVFLGVWSLGAACSPLSGLNLMLQGRYQVSASLFPRRNTVFMLLMLVVFCIVLHLYAKQ